MPNDDLLHEFAAAYAREAVLVSTTANSGYRPGVHGDQELPEALRHSEQEFWHEFWKDWWANHRPAAPEPPEVLGPFNCDIRFKDPAPVGGWNQISFFRDGTWNWSGHLHNSGMPEYDYEICWAVNNLGTGQTFVLPRKGHLGGTFGGGSRDDNWGDSNQNGPLAKSWDGFFEGGVSWSCVTGVNADFDSIVETSKKAVAAGAEIIALL